MNLKLRLIFMNFLQYAIWGAWLISLGAYLGGNLGFTGVQIGSFFATMGIASLFMPALLGIVADRFIPAERLLGICHLLGAAFLFLAAPQTEYAMLYTYLLLAVFFYMPTIALSNAVAYNALEKSNLDIVKTFPPIRVWGTVGFIISMIAVDLLRVDGMKFSQTSYQLYFAGALSVILGVYSFTLPKCSTNPKSESKSWVDNFGLRAFALFKQRKMAVFFTFSMLLGVALQITNMFANDFLTNHFGAMPQFQDTFGVKYANILISISQMSETLCILLIPFFLKRFGIKKVMLISMFAWILRFALLGLGDPGSGVWMLVLSMLVYGVAFDFFNISGSLFVEQETSPKIRSSAQGLFMIMTNGFGAFLGSYAAGKVFDMVGWPNAWFVFTAYSVVVMILFAILFKYKHDPVKIERHLSK